MKKYEYRVIGINIYSFNKNY